MDSKTRARVINVNEVAVTEWVKCSNMGPSGEVEISIAPKHWVVKETDKEGNTHIALYWPPKTQESKAIRNFLIKVDRQTWIR